MTQFQGVTFLRDSANQLLNRPNVKIVFSPELGGSDHQTSSDAAGRYQITLPAGRYVAEAFENEQKVFSTGTGFVVASQERQTFNVIISGPPPPRFEVQGLIHQKWEKLNGGQGPLGDPTTQEVRVSGGALQHFEHGSITLEMGDNGQFKGEAFAVWGAIQDHWIRLRGVNGILGFAQTDETASSDGSGRFNHFEGGSIYWTPQTGAHLVLGAIRALWSQMRSERSWLGYPTTDEVACPSPKSHGRFNHFQGGAIYWTPATGAVALPKVIFNEWGRHGHELGSLGFPVPKLWGRNLSAFGLNLSSSNLFLFEGGVLVEQADGSVRVIKHSAIVSSQFNTGTWSKHGEINRDNRPFVGSQGLTYHPGTNASERRWFVTKHSGKLPDLDQITKLDKHFDHEFRNNNLGNSFKIDHAGDCDVWQDRVYVACQGPSLVAILDRDVQKIGLGRLQPREDGVFPLGSDHLSWCAVNPCDGLLYTSDFNQVNAVHGFDRERGWRYTKTIQLNRTVQRVQGGAFTPNGLLVLACDDRADQAFAHIKFFNGHGGHFLCDKPVERTWEDSKLSDQEIEGVCFAPGVPYGKSTALHTIVIKTNVPNRQSWIKHYHMPPDQLAWM
ncbi:MAG: hypothetical protein WA960_02355 [Tunicatimonas sp.]